MSISFKELQREVNRRCGDYVWGRASGAGLTTTLVDSRLGTTYKTNDYFNYGTIVLNKGTSGFLFNADCETMTPGNFTSVTVTDSACRVHRDDSFPQYGTYGYKFVTGSDASDQAYVSKTLAATATTLYAQAFIYLPADYTGAAQIMRFDTAGDVAIVSVKLTGGNLSVYNHIATETYTPTSYDVTVETLHRLELAVTISATVGTIDLLLDGEHIYSGRGLNTGSTAIGKLLVGLMGTTVAEAKTIYIDEVKADTSYIGDRTDDNERTITDYAYSSGTLTFGTVGIATAEGDEYELFDWPKTTWGLRQKKQAINNAVNQLWPEWWKSTVDPASDSGDATITIASNTFHYTLPDRCGLVTAVYIEGSTSSTPYTPLTHCRFIRSGGTSYLHLPNANAYTSGKKVRVVYCAVPQPLVNDNDVLDVDEKYVQHAAEFVICTALANLWRSQSPDDTSMAKSIEWSSLANIERARYAQPVPMSNIFTEVQAKKQDFIDRVRIA